MRATMKGGSLCWVAVENSTQFGVQNVRTLRDISTTEAESFHIKDREDLLYKYKSLGPAELKKKMLDANFKAEEIELSLRICAVMSNNNNVVAAQPRPSSAPIPVGKTYQAAFDPFLCQNNRKRSSCSPPKLFSLSDQSSFPATNKFSPPSSTRPSKQPKSSKVTPSKAPGLDPRFPTTSIQIKFRDGSSLVCIFNYSQTVEELKGYIDSINPSKGENYQLVTSYPRRVLDNASLTLQSAGLHRATVMLQSVNA